MWGNRRRVQKVEESRLEVHTRNVQKIGQKAEKLFVFAIVTQKA